MLIFNFNTKKVRLKQIGRSWATLLTTTFQYQKGAIKTSRQEEPGRVGLYFNTKKVRLKPRGAEPSGHTQ